MSAQVSNGSTKPDTDTAPCGQPSVPQSPRAGHLNVATVFTRSTIARQRASRDQPGGRDVGTAPRPDCEHDEYRVPADAQDAARDATAVGGTSNSRFSRRSWSPSLELVPVRIRGPARYSADVDQRLVLAVAE